MIINWEEFKEHYALYEKQETRLSDGFLFIFSLLKY